MSRNQTFHQTYQTDNLKQHIIVLSALVKFISALHLVLRLSLEMLQNQSSLTLTCFGFIIPCLKSWACRRQQTLHYQSRNKYWEGISSPELQDTLQSGQLPSTAPSNTHYMTMTKDRLRAAATNLFCYFFWVFAAMADREELGC